MDSLRFHGGDRSYYPTRSIDRLSSGLRRYSYGSFRLDHLNSVYFRVVFERHELQHQDTLCVRFHIVEYLVHSAVNAARLLCDFVSAQQRYTVCEYVEQPVPSRRLMRFRRSEPRLGKMQGQPVLPGCERYVVCKVPVAFALI